VVPAIRPATKTAPTTVLGDPRPAAAPVEGPSREADEALARLLAEIAGVPETSGAGSTPPGSVAALAPARSATRPSSGPSYRVQLAAVREQDDAGRAWKDLAERLGPLVADYEPFYERAETSNGVFTRIQLGPFASEEAADRLCVEVQRQNASCFVVSP
jgi:cell division septation protein DedD